MTDQLVNEERVIELIAEIVSDADLDNLPPILQATPLVRELRRVHAELERVQALSKERRKWIAEHYVDTEWNCCVECQHNVDSGSVTHADTCPVPRLTACVEARNVALERVAEAAPEYQAAVARTPPDSGQRRYLLLIALDDESVVARETNP